MKRSSLFIASACLATIFSVDCRAQKNDPSQIDRAKWQEQVQAARKRLELMRRQHSSFLPQEPSRDEIAETASKRALEDDSLQPGDIISTTHGLFRFRGASNGRRTAD